jgi:hypothetical protein
LAEVRSPGVEKPGFFARLLLKTRYLHRNPVSETWQKGDHGVRETGFLYQIFGKKQEINLETRFLRRVGWGAIAWGRETGFLCQIIAKK